MSDQSCSSFHLAHQVGGQWQRSDEPMGSHSSSSSPVASLNPVSNMLHTTSAINTQPNQPFPNAHGSSSTATRNGANGLWQSPTLPKIQTETLMQLAELQKMANRYQIPSVLPKPPVSALASTSSAASSLSPPSSTSPLAPAPAVGMVPPQQSALSPSEPMDPQIQLVANYLAMLNQPTAPSPSTYVAPLPEAGVESCGIAVEMASPEYPVHQMFPEMDASAYLTSPQDVGLGDEFMASPSFDTSPCFTDFSADDFTSPLLSDTSPLLTTPYLDDFATSPNMESPCSPDLSTPVMDAVDDVYVEGAGGQWPALFDDPVVGMYRDIEQKQADAAGVSGYVEERAETVSPSSTTVPSPPINTASSLPSSSDPTPPPQPTTTRSLSHAPRVAAPRPRTVYNGTRKGVTPDSLISPDAPVQPRNYHGPSSTSRRTSAKRKSEGNDDEDGEEDFDPDTKRDAKRLKNTLAARQSRRRKAEHLEWLMSDNERLNRDVEMWKTRAEVLQGMLKGYGCDIGLDDIRG
ncbi:hypothetical protein V5O48_014902 [Marasmius crinis-equi]|uniref:BZIP domain-containing protein n=1 Tax=Marasmius crinis-equi TaxID=585013 RepID=A0ABR3EW17_9AGAR